MRDYQSAQLLINCLDLTSLNKDDNETNINNLCQKAITPYGNVAAVCVYSKFVPLVQKNLENTKIKIASVVNFPDATASISAIREETKKAIGLGANEIDAVFPYKNFMDGDIKTCNKFLEMISKECSKHTSKVIIETGELKTSSNIIQASKLCIEHGINFIKTSTGKTKVSASVEACNLILETIKESGNPNVGFKASGGIKTFEEALQYLRLSQIIMGQDWSTPNRLRIGASSLLTDLIQITKKGY